MDFKVAGNKEGITTFQLDIKCEGLTLDIMKKALEQAKEGRLHILGEMEKALKEPRAELPATVPKMLTMKIEEESIGKVIGPGGRQIRAIIEDFGLENMDVAEDGTIQISGFDLEQMKKAEEMVTLLTSSMGGKGGRGKDKEPKVPYAGPEPEEGKTYTGKITGIHDFGVFLEFMPGAEDGSYPGLEGLCHVSELHVERVRNCEGFLKSMNTETLEGKGLNPCLFHVTETHVSRLLTFDIVMHLVQYIGKNNRGKYSLSRKKVLEANRKGGNRSNGKGPAQRSAPQDPPPAEMKKEEVDVIAQAIESVENA